MLCREGRNSFLQQSKLYSNAKPGLYVDIFPHCSGSCLNSKVICVSQSSKHYNNLKTKLFLQLCIMIQTSRKDYHLQTKSWHYWMVKVCIDVLSRISSLSLLRAKAGEPASQHWGGRDAGGWERVVAWNHHLQECELNLVTWGIIFEELMNVIVLECYYNVT